MDTRTYYMDYTVQPKRGDIIMEVGWNGEKPTHLIQTFEIAHVDDMREQNGRVEFYIASCKEKNVKTNIREMKIRKLGKIRNYEILYERER